MLVGFLHNMRRCSHPAPFHDPCPHKHCSSLDTFLLLPSTRISRLSQPPLASHNTLLPFTTTSCALKTTSRLPLPGNCCNLRSQTTSCTHTTTSRFPLPRNTHILTLIRTTSCALTTNSSPTTTTRNSRCSAAQAALAGQVRTVAADMPGPRSGTGAVRRQPTCRGPRAGQVRTAAGWGPRHRRELKKRMAMTVPAMSTGIAEMRYRTP
jgi:hypothetical protein